MPQQAHVRWPRVISSSALGERVAHKDVEQLSLTHWKSAFSSPSCWDLSLGFSLMAFTRERSARGGASSNLYLCSRRYWKLFGVRVGELVLGADSRCLFPDLAGFRAEE